MPIHEVTGRADIKAALDGGDVQITGLTATHVEIQSYYDLGRILYSIGAAPAFPADWHAVEKKDTVLVFLNGGVQLNLRKLEYFREVNRDVAAELVDVQATVSVEEQDMS